MNLLQEYAVPIYDGYTNHTLLREIEESNESTFA
jgi:hypothetical protein